MHWERLEGDEDARHELVKLIVERVYVRDEQVVAMTLRSNYHLVLNHKTNGPTEFTVDPMCVTFGSDGHGGLEGCSSVILATNANHPAIVQYLLKNWTRAPSYLTKIRT